MPGFDSIMEAHRHVFFRRAAAPLRELTPVTSERVHLTFLDQRSPTLLDLCERLSFPTQAARTMRKASMSTSAVVSGCEACSLRKRRQERTLGNPA
jgi:hypothetical protein